MENNQPKKIVQSVSLDANTMNTLVNMMRNMVRQELGSSKNVQQKPRIDTSKAISIRDEIRNIVRQELQLMKNNTQPNKAQVQPAKQQVQVRPIQSKIVPQQRPVQQTKQVAPQQNNNNNNVVRITSIQQLAEHLQRSINEQIQKRQQIAGKSMQKNPVQVKVVSQQKQTQNRPINAQVKITPNAIRPNPNNQNQQKSSSKDFAQKNVISQKQAGDLLSNIARKVPKPGQNFNQQKK